MKKTGGIGAIGWILGTVTVSLGVVFWLNNYSNALPIRMYLVQSGSMEPSIMTGDVILVRRRNLYAKGQVITFKEDSGRVVTHRVIEESEKDGVKFYLTKGDANRSIDSDHVSLENVIGNVVFSVPKIGFLVGFVKSTPGYLTLILIPAVLTVLWECKNIVKELA